MKRLVQSIGFYLIGLLAYGQVVSYILGGETLNTTGDRLGAVFAGLCWMAIWAFIFEVHDTFQGLRADILDTLDDWFDSIKMPKISLPKRTRKNDIIPGVTRPTTILAEMLAARIFLHPEKLTFSGSNYASSGSNYEWFDRNIDIVVRFRSVTTDAITNFRMERKGSLIELDESEMLKIQAACLRAKEQNLSSNTTQNQILAVDCIESLLQLEPAPKEKVVNLRTA